MGLSPNVRTLPLRLRLFVGCTLPLWHRAARRSPRARAGAEPGDFIEGRYTVERSLGNSSRRHRAANTNKPRNLDARRATPFRHLTANRARRCPRQLTPGSARAIRGAGVNRGETSSPVDPVNPRTASPFSRPSDSPICRLPYPVPVSSLRIPPTGASFHRYY